MNSDDNTLWSSLVSMMIMASGLVYLTILDRLDFFLDMPSQLTTTVLQLVFLGSMSYMLGTSESLSDDDGLLDSVVFPDSLTSVLLVEFALLEILVILATGGGGTLSLGLLCRGGLNTEPGVDRCCDPLLDLVNIE